MSNFWMVNCEHILGGQFCTSRRVGRARLRLGTAEPFSNWSEGAHL